MTSTQYPHLEQHENGTVYVAGTGFKLLPLISEHVYWKWGPEQMVAQHPGLSLGAAHAVLSYFYDHEADVRAEMDRRRRRADELLTRIGRKLDKRELLARLQADVLAEVET